MLKATKDFQFIFFVEVLYKLFNEIAVLSKCLQSEELHLEAATDVCRETRDNVKKMRSKEAFNKFWHETDRFAESNDIEPASLPRRRQVPAKLADHLPLIANFDTVEQKFESIYYNLIDIVVSELDRRFDKAKLAPITAIYELITKPALNEDQISRCLSNMHIYSDFVSFAQLKLELNIWQGYKKHHSKINTINELREHFVLQNLNHTFPEIFKLFIIYLCVPLNSAKGERSFSALRRIKSWLRASCGQERLSDLALLHIESEELLLICLEEAINIFACQINRRIDLMY